VKGYVDGGSYIETCTVAINLKYDSWDTPVLKYNFLTNTNVKKAGVKSDAVSDTCGNYTRDFCTISEAYSSEGWETAFNHAPGCAINNGDGTATIMPIENAKDQDQTCKFKCLRRKR
jgi:hypothetical protein